MTDQEHIDHLHNELKYAGGFQTALIEAWFKADGGNKRTLEEAFPHDHRIPIGKPPIELSENTVTIPMVTNEDEACDMLYGVDNNQCDTGKHGGPMAPDDNQFNDDKHGGLLQ